AAESHTVTVARGVGSPASQTVTLTAPTALSLSLAKTDLACNGAGNGTITATFSGGTGPYTVQIDGGSFVSATSPYQFTGVTAATHTVVVKDPNGCTTTQTSTLTQPTAIALSLTKSDGCPGQSNGTITATFSG